MNLGCPNKECSNYLDPSNVKSNGAYVRMSDGARVKRYRCPVCGHTFSEATFSDEKKDIRRDVNQELKKCWKEGITNVEAARRCKISPITVSRKYKKYAALWASEEIECLKNSPVIENQTELEVQKEDTAEDQPSYYFHDGPEESDYSYSYDDFENSLDTDVA